MTSNTPLNDGKHSPRCAIILTAEQGCYYCKGTGLVAASGGYQPSERGLALLKRAKEAAAEEVARHRAAGRSVHGRKVGASEQPAAEPYPAMPAVTLGPEDAAKVSELIDNPPPPNAFLREAMNKAAEASAQPERAGCVICGRTILKRDLTYYRGSVVCVDANACQRAVIDFKEALG